VDEVELSIVMPCLNEAETLAVCIGKANAFLAESHIRGEVIVADNGSTDGSQDIARRLGARLVSIPERGYGAALIGGIEAATGRFIVMGDADDSYDFEHLDLFVGRLRAGDDLVMGNRFRGGIRENAMPLHHRYLGNPVLTGIGRVLFRSPIGDFHCGLRGFRRAAIRALDLQTMGMEFASEMVVKATLQGLKVSEVPTVLSADGRSRPPHLRSWRDGWRHLRFMLLFSPRWLFLYPGAALMLFGLAVSAWLLPGPRAFGGANLDITTLLYASVAVIVGLDGVLFAVSSKVVGIRANLLPYDERFDRFLKLATLERCLIGSGLLILAGIAGLVYAFYTWSSYSFGSLNPSVTFRIAIPSVTALACGVQVAFSAFFLSILEIGLQNSGRGARPRSP
jgi:glycosyltransferase involved in cell wall biosynthesis